MRRVAQGFPALGAAEVEDVVQETFVRAFKELPRLRHPQAFSHWLATIAAASRAVAQPRGALAGAGGGVPLAPAGAGSARAARVAGPGAARRRGAQPHRGAARGAKQTARLFYVEGELSAREIAEQLGLGKSAITMRLERFRARQRELLGRLLASEME